MARKLMFKDDEESKRYFEKQKQMESNSKKWHETDDKDERDRLHFKNQELSGELDLIDGGNRTFDDKTGVWSVDYGNKNQTGGQWQPEDTGYKSKYGEKIESALGDISGDKFLYNPESDPSYKAYESMYRREGDRASKSTLADISAAQGGVSSYAASAAQQASNAYAEALTDKIPELEALAYQKYLGERDDKYNRLNTLLTLDDIDYGRYIDDRSRNDQLDRYKVADEQWQTEFDNNNYWLGRDDEWKQKEFDNNNYWLGRDDEWKQKYFDEDIRQYNAEQSNSARNESYNRAMALISYGVMPRVELLSEADISPEEARAMLNNIFSSSNGSSGGSGGKKKSGSSKYAVSDNTAGESSSRQIDGSVPFMYSVFAQNSGFGKKSSVEDQIDTIYNMNARGEISDREAEKLLTAIEEEERNKENL